MESAFPVSFQPSSVFLSSSLSARLRSRELFSGFFLSLFQFWSTTPSFLARKMYVTPQITEWEMQSERTRQWYPSKPPSHGEQGIPDLAALNCCFMRCFRLLRSSSDGIPNEFRPFSLHRKCERQTEFRPW